jgi:hypothetical protein
MRHKLAHGCASLAHDSLAMIGNCALPPKLKQNLNPQLIRINLPWFHATH